MFRSDSERGACHSRDLLRGVLESLAEGQRLVEQPDGLVAIAGGGRRDPSEMQRIG